MKSLKYIIIACLLFLAMPGMRIALGQDLPTFLRDGDEAFALGKTDEAETYFTQALSVTSDDKEKRKVLGRLLAVADRREDTPKMHNLSREILNQDPGNNWAAFMLAKVEAMQRKEGDLFSKETIAQVQEKLIAIGYLEGKADGAWGPKTAEAINSFRTDSGLGKQAGIDGLLLGWLNIKPEYKTPHIILQEGACQNKKLYKTSNDGRYQIYTCSSQLAVFDTKQEKFVKYIDALVYEASFNQSGTYLAVSTDKRVTVYSTENFEINSSIKQEKKDGIDDMAGIIEFTDNDQHMIMVSDSNISIRDTKTFIKQSTYEIKSYGGPINLIKGKNKWLLLVWDHWKGSINHGNNVNGSRIGLDMYQINIETLQVINVLTDGIVKDVLVGEDDTIKLLYNDYLEYIILNDPSTSIKINKDGHSTIGSYKINSSNYKNIIISEYFDFVRGWPFFINKSISEPDEEHNEEQQHSISHTPLFIKDNFYTDRHSCKLEGITEFLGHARGESGDVELISKDGCLKSPLVFPFTWLPASMIRNKIDDLMTEHKSGEKKFDVNLPWIGVEDESFFSSKIGRYTAGLFTHVYAGTEFSPLLYALWVWNTNSGKLQYMYHITILDDGGAGGEYTFSFNQDGTLIAIAGERTIRIVDAATGNTLKTLDCAIDHIDQVYFGNSGKQISVIQNGAQAEIWNYDTNQLVARSFYLADKNWITITPEGFFDSEKGSEVLTIIDRGIASAIGQYYDLLYRPDLVQEALKGDPEGKLAEARHQLKASGALQAGPPPAIRFTNSSDDKGIRSVVRIDNSKLPIFKAEVKDQGGGIGRIEWRINGVTSAVDNRQDRSVKRLDGGAKPELLLDIEQALSLPPGENQIEVVAYNARNSVASRPATMKVTVEGAVAQETPRLFIMAVGINEYWDSSLRLTNAVSDARSLGQQLQTAGKGLFQEVDIKYVLDADANQQRLDTYFQELAPKVRSTDVFVLFLAGHGVTSEGRYYFIPQDFHYRDKTSFSGEGISQEQWQKWLASLPAQKSIFLIDTCESGSMTDPQLPSRGLEQMAAMDRLMRATGRTTIAASQENAPALEGYKGHGLFTFVLLDALTSADRNRNGMVEISELIGRVDEQLPELSHKTFGYRQVPRIMMQGSDFALVNTITDTITPSPQGGAPPQDQKQNTVKQDKPSHVLIRPEVLRKQPGLQGEEIKTLQTGSLVTVSDGASVVVEGNDKERLIWREISCQGTSGYIPAASLLEVH